MALSDAGSPLPFAEQTKRDRLREGRPIEFPTPPDGSETPEARAARTIPSKWLDDLAVEPDRVFRTPIRISNAIIDGPLRQPYATFEYDFVITGTEFTGEVDLSFATFKRSVKIDDSRFAARTSLRGAHALH